jgi:2-polyprenyl-3-methyl-5-hydroxy-6-metoxy-1,4-benzoquinol methylase
MASKHTRFRIFYRIGFTPWEGHPLAQGLKDLIEGTGDAPALPTGSALDLGCGTGDASIYLAQHGWNVTAVDYVAKPLEKARRKAQAAQVSIDFARADVTQLSRAGIGSGFKLIVDNGCLHNMSDGDRDAYVREVSAVSAPDALLGIVAFVPGGRLGVPGIDRAEVERRFTHEWAVLSAGDERGLDRQKTPTKFYLLQRRS